LDIQNATGRALSRDLGAVYTPTFILYDAQGQELLRRVGSLTPDDIQQALFLR
jgi:protein-disulfide isomerase